MTRKLKENNMAMNENLGHWLSPAEQHAAIGLLADNGLLKLDNQHKLPLKSGGTTDIYVNLRMMRSHPHALQALALLYSNPLRRLGKIDRIVEVPEAVSPLAGALSALTGIPLVTVRGEAKPGRVVEGTIIGDLRPGERVVIIDDVITDGASKIPAIEAIARAGAELVALVVLVDRQQGWKEKLSHDLPPSKNLLLPGILVWSAMTLHDIRRYAIEDHEDCFPLMQRCDLAVEGANPLIVALDGKSWDEILPFLDKIRTSGCILKVNDLMLAKGLDWILPNLSVYGRVMIDLKGHDIPATVANACTRMRPCPPWAVTVHASGGMEMINAAVKALEGTGTKVLAVTVLTSLAEEDCKEIYNRLPMDQVVGMAKLAHDAGADGIVCSPEEVGVLSSMPWGHKMLFVTPGIRSPGKDANDQRRVGTPAEAMKAGATHLVMGRQILGAADPAAEVARLLKDEIAST
jgi:orotidine-5'-phosphate decarboxylase